MESGMKLAKVLLAASVSLGLATAAQAEQGKIEFKGTVLESACVIDSGDLNQQIDFQEIPQSRLNLGGKSDTQDFQIKLKNCDNSTMKNVDIAFSGNGGFGDTFGVTGVDNLGVIIAQNGQAIAPGGSISNTLLQGDNTFDFQTYVMGDPAVGNDVTTGDFTSIANFVITYS